MKKKRRRMTERDIQMVVEEIEAWGRGERGKRLTWAVLERIFPFTRQTMSSKERIQTVYASAKLPLKVGIYSTEFFDSHKISDTERQALKNRIKHLENQVIEWQKLWVLLNK